MHTTFTILISIIKLKAKREGHTQAAIILKIFKTN